MVEIFGKTYYIDLDRITEKCRIEKNTEEEKINDDISELNDDSQTINIFKYELIKMCIERILTEDSEVDETMGPFASNTTTVSFRIAFNTLVKNEILIENEYE
jgi:hypothetical protein